MIRIKLVSLNIFLSGTIIPSVRTTELISKWRGFDSKEYQKEKKKKEVPKFHSLIHPFKHFFQTCISHNYKQIFPASPELIHHQQRNRHHGILKNTYHPMCQSYDQEMVTVLICTNSME